MLHPDTSDRREVRLPTPPYGLPLSVWAVIAGGLLLILSVGGCSIRESLSPVGKLELLSHPVGLIVTEENAYVLCQNDGLHIINVSRPEMPWESGTLEFTFPGGVQQGVTMKDIFLLIAASSQLIVINVSDSTTPEFVGSYSVISPRGIQDIVVVGNHAFVAAVNGLLVFDVSDPATQLEIVGTLNLSGNVQHLVVVGDYAYISAGDGGLHIVRIADPTRPILLGSLPLPGRAKDLAVVKGHAFVITTDHGIQIVDVRNPLAPKIVEVYDKPKRVWDADDVLAPPVFHPLGVTAYGDLLFVAGNNNYLRVLDVSTPAEPREVGRGYGIEAEMIAISNNIAFIFDGRELQVVPLDTDGDGYIVGEDAYPHFASLHHLWQGMLIALTATIAAVAIAFGVSQQMAQHRKVHIYTRDPEKPPGRLTSLQGGNRITLSRKRR